MILPTPSFEFVPTIGQRRAIREIAEEIAEAMVRRFNKQGAKLNAKFLDDAVRQAMRKGSFRSALRRAPGGLPNPGRAAMLGVSRMSRFATGQLAKGLPVKFLVKTLVIGAALIGAANLFPGLVTEAAKEVFNNVIDGIANWMCDEGEFANSETTRFLADLSASDPKIAAMLLSNNVITRTEYEALLGAGPGLQTALVTGDSEGARAEDRELFRQLHPVVAKIAAYYGEKLPRTKEECIQSWKDTIGWTVAGAGVLALATLAYLWFWSKRQAVTVTLEQPPLGKQVSRRRPPRKR